MTITYTVYYDQVLEIEVEDCATKEHAVAAIEKYEKEDYEDFEWANSLHGEEPKDGEYGITFKDGDKVHSEQIDTGMISKCKSKHKESLAGDNGLKEQKKALLNECKIVTGRVIWHDGNQYIVESHESKFDRSMNFPYRFKTIHDLCDYCEVYIEEVTA